MALLKNRLVIGFGLLVFVTIIGKITWTKYGHLVVENERYRVTADDIHVTPPPEWVQSDVRGSAIRLGKLEELSLLDRDLVTKVDEAFRLQTWVADVESVRKTPQGIEVAIRYRQPVAMVEIVADGAPKLQPIDGEGVLLPGSEFSQSQAIRYVRVSVPAPRMHGLIDGTQWPDERIVHAARIAEALAPFMKSLRIFRINMMMAEANVTRRSPVFEIQTALGHRIIWGSAPGEEISGEADVESRLETLDSLAAALSARPDQGPDHWYDIRSGTAIRINQEAPTTSEQDSPNANPWGLDP